MGLKVIGSGHVGCAPKMERINDRFYVMFPLRDYKQLPIANNGVCWWRVMLWSENKQKLTDLMNKKTLQKGSIVQITGDAFSSAEASVFDGHRVMVNLDDLVVLCSSSDNS
ncbi:hypothetical protein AB4254_08950 [Vibrio breoganii]